MTLQFTSFTLDCLLLFYMVSLKSLLAAAGEWRLDLRCERGIKPKRSCISSQINGHNETLVPPSLLPDTLPFSLSLSLIESPHLRPQQLSSATHVIVPSNVVQCVKHH